MALSNEDKKDVSREMGKKMANKVERATNDFESWRKSRSGTHSKSIAKKLNIPLHETDWQRRRRQRNEVKKHGITGATPKEAAKNIKAHTKAKSEAIKGKLFDKKFRDDKSRGIYAGKSLEAAMDYESRRQKRNQ